MPSQKPSVDLLRAKGEVARTEKMKARQDLAHTKSKNKVYIFRLWVGICVAVLVALILVVLLTLYTYEAYKDGTFLERVDAVITYLVNSLPLAAATWFFTSAYYKRRD